MDKDYGQKVKPFACHGINFRKKQGEQAIGDCPFCGKTQHFYVDMRTGQWDCKVCGKKGNTVSFLGEYCDTIFSDTSNVDFIRLKKKRGLPVRAYRDWKVSWDGEHWLLPVHSEKKTIRDIRRWDPKTKVMKSTAGCKVQLYGAYKVAKLKKDGTIYVCEGEFDCIALSYVLGKCKEKNARAVAVPGATTFKDEWTEFFRDRNVVLCYDNDGAGEMGLKKAVEKLTGVALTIESIRWPADKKKGYDLGDYIVDRLKNDKKCKTIYKDIKKVVHKLEDIPELGHLLEDYQGASDGMDYIDDPPSWGEVLEVFGKHLYMTDELDNGLKICMASAFSQVIKGDPLWLYFVAPPGAGKTQLMMSLFDSKRCMFRSNVSSKALVSGQKDQKDCSLIPLFDGKCVIFKDFTEMISKNQNDKDLIFSTLRGAFDGHVYVNYGNGVEREYFVNFALIAGVTPTIHGENQVAMGDRMLKYEIFPGVGWNMDRQIEAAIANVGKEDEMNEEMQEISKLFLARFVGQEHIPKIPRWFVKRLKPLAQLVSMCRAQCAFEKYRGDNAELLYSPTHESGTRISKQLTKLAMSLAIVDNEDFISPENYAIVERVAFDTSTRIHMMIIKKLIKCGGGATAAEIIDMTGLPHATVQRRLDSLHLLGILEKISYTKAKSSVLDLNRNSKYWKVSRRIKQFWAEAEIGIPPGQEDRKPRKRIKVKVRRNFTQGSTPLQ